MRNFFDEIAEKKGWDVKKVEQARIDVAKKLLIQNRPIEKIVEDTDLIRETVEGLRF